MRSISTFVVMTLVATGLAGAVHAQPPGGGGPGGGMNIMERLDTDKDGKISQAEYTTFAEARWGRISNGADKVNPSSLQGFQASALAGITPAADGTVSKAAYEAAIPAKFKAADTDGDGSLTQAELMASMGPMRRPGA